MRYNRRKQRQSCFFSFFKPWINWFISARRGHSMAQWREMNTRDGFDNSILVFSFFLLHCAPVTTRREILFRDKWLMLNSNENKTRWLLDIVPQEWTEGLWSTQASCILMISNQLLMLSLVHVLCQFFHPSGGHFVWSSPQCQEDFCHLDAFQSAVYSFMQHG